ncbi:MAG: phage terminase large subunit family protein [Sphingomonas sp.]|nr:phage terminase large subunit family protein [Sphingomonas sp.]
MWTPQQIESRLVDLGAHRHDGRARDAWAARLDHLLPAKSISINRFNETKRKMVNPGGEPFDYDASLTPYLRGINDAIDTLGVHWVAVKGPGRAAKTVSAESMCLRNWTYRSKKNVIWFMQDEDSIADYIDERGEEMLRIHPEVNEQVNWNDRRTGRLKKRIGKSLLTYRPATARHTRAKAAPVIVADEIDAYEKKIRKAILALITTRQLEFGSDAKAYLASHPDAGPEEGIDQVLADSTLHLWHVRCPHCGGASAVAREAEAWGVPMLDWNVPELMKRGEDMEREAFLDHVKANVVICCPHDGCNATFKPEELRRLNAAGTWLQRHQRWLPDGSIEGERKISKGMGFVIHAFMAPFADIRDTARGWASAAMTAELGDPTRLKEIVVKQLGETFRGTKVEEQAEDWKTVQARLASPYALKTVPAGVRFLTAFVDVQGDRFEVRVIGWDLALQSWLIDAYAIKQWPAMKGRSAFENIQPATRLSDWDVIEEAVLAASYPLASNPERKSAGLEELFLPIARTVINGAGEPGVVGNARVWMANLLGRAPGEGRLIRSYRVLLMQGSASKTGEVYGKPKVQEFDDRGRKLRVPIYERYPNVHELKRIIATRRAIAEPGPGRMHLPQGLPPKIWRELVSERLVNGTWIKTNRANETWDGWVACELGRATLRPERRELWADGGAPDWATPVPRGQGIETMLAAPVSIFDRLAALNS